MLSNFLPFLKNQKIWQPWAGISTQEHQPSVLFKQDHLCFSLSQSLAFSMALYSSLVFYFLPWTLKTSEFGPLTSTAGHDEVTGSGLTIKCNYWKTRRHRWNNCFQIFDNRQGGREVNEGSPTPTSAWRQHLTCGTGRENPTGPCSLPELKRLTGGQEDPSG